jgi:uncharacterized protein (TIGR02217 family)
MATFSEALFPLEVSAWAVGGRAFKTTVVQTYGGDEYRNAAWAQTLGEWEIADAFRAINPNSAHAMAALRNFLMAGMGQLYGFRFRDPQDYTDETHGILKQIGATANWQLYKRYSITSLTYDQIITKPVSTISVTGGVVSSIDYTTGIVTMTSGTPTAWTGTFDIPARFAEDGPKIGLDGTGAVFDWQALKIVELRTTT